jgi:hypothetical protein
MWHAKFQSILSPMIESISWIMSNVNLYIKEILNHYCCSKNIWTLSQFQRSDSLFSQWYFSLIHSQNMKAYLVFSTFTSGTVSLLATYQTWVFLHMFTFLPSKVKTRQTKCEFDPFNLNPSWLSTAFLTAHPKVTFKSKGITALSPKMGGDGVVVGTIHKVCIICWTQLEVEIL